LCLESWWGVAVATQSWPSFAVDVDMQDDVDDGDEDLTSEELTESSGERKKKDVKAARLQFIGTFVDIFFFFFSSDLM
jgi:hypothetical protein